MSYQIIADSPCDLPYTHVDEHTLPILSIPYIIDGQDFFGDMGRADGFKGFYDTIRSGTMPTTSQVTDVVYAELFEPYLKAGKDVLFLSFSSALSHTIVNAYSAAEQLNQRYSDCKVEVFDTRNVSAGTGLLVLAALKNQADGMNLEENLQWLRQHQENVNVFFAVNNLDHLRRGGRISPTVAMVGKLLDVKPMLRVNPNGAIEPIEKVKGRKKALRALLSKVENNIINAQDQTLIVMHGDCLEDANRLAEMVRIRIPVKDVEIWPVGPVVGTHSGPDVIAVAFMGKQR